ncbi:RNA exonuclease 4 [Xenopus laevis]|uniref:RNA exonuclease 4 n=1 Tax=Xenopus laevis TaxID=8355 RepID=REXO4_XENLA|nr:RNA exonuclease 4 [Xenopus laevis]Q91560.2 RecName: Full=RNA exonuclease 4; AltName: Full=Exonuclease XPMC2; AltName: Full=Prevents mitotic catastrophe 2 protein [Xenopus laevis]AAH43958.1 Xpmc2 protein [Xenopus laevis]
MAKAKVKKDQSPCSGSLGKTANTPKQKRKQKQRKFWQNHPKITTKTGETKKVSLLLPPKGPQEFSSNWKALQELLKPKENQALPATTLAKCPKKDQKVSEKKTEESVPQKSGHKINGGITSVSAIAKGAKAPSQATPTKAAEKSDEVSKGKKRKIMAEATDTEHQGKKPQGEAQPQPPKVDIWFDDVDPDDIEAALGPEAGRVAREMQGITDTRSPTVDKILVKERAFEGLTRTVAMDCEMVGVGMDGEESILARVSIVNLFGKCVYDKYVKPTERVTDYRTAVSGIRPEDVKKGEPFKVVQKEVSEILRGRTLVGHAVHNDLKILFLDHPKKAIRDTQKYKPFKQKVKSGRPSLKLLCEKILNVKVQTGEHCSVQDAQAAMRLYTMEKKSWEVAIKAKYTGVMPVDRKSKGPQKDKQCPQ